MFFSLDICKSLCLVYENFPHINVSETSLNTIANKIERLITERPVDIAFPATDGNIPQLEHWLLDKFADTAFNNFDPLPVMYGKPHQFHLKDNAMPHAAHTPILILHHWKQDVKRQLDNDVRMGIIRKAPVGETTECRMRMVTVAKKDGSPGEQLIFSL